MPLEKGKEEGEKPTAMPSFSSHVDAVMEEDPRTCSFEVLKRNLRAIFDKWCSGENKIDRTQEFPPEMFLELKKAGLLHAFLPEEHGGRKSSQREIQELLRLAAEYGVDTVLRTGIEGALIIQPLTAHGTPEQIAEFLPQVMEGRGGALGITEESASGSAIVAEMKTTFEELEGDMVRVEGVKYLQGLSGQDFMIVAAREIKGDRVVKAPKLIIVPGDQIKEERMNMSVLQGIPYSRNTISATVPKANVIDISLREFQNLFIRSRLQFIGMTHGVLDLVCNQLEYQVREAKIRPSIDRVRQEIDEIHIRQNLSHALYEYVCETVSPEQPVGGMIMQAAIIKALGSELTQDSARVLKKLGGGVAFETQNPMGTPAIDFEPFTIFEGTNDMLFGDVFREFSKPGPEERERRTIVDPEVSVFARLVGCDSTRFAGNMEERARENLPAEIIGFLEQHSLSSVKSLGGVAEEIVGRIIAKLFTWSLLDDSDEAYESSLKWIIKDIRKWIIEFEALM